MCYGTAPPNGVACKKARTLTNGQVDSCKPWSLLKNYQLTIFL